MSLPANDLIPFTVQFSKRRRSVALQIIQGELIVRAPYGFCQTHIKRLVEQKRNWINRHLAKTRQQQKIDWISDGAVPFQEQNLTLCINRATRSNSVQVGNTLLLSISTRVADTRFPIVIRNQLILWYRDIAQSWFENCVVRWQKEMKLYPVSIHIGNWRSRWGYCKANGEVGFNWRLMMAPAWVAEYVVVHELAHLKFMNHSDAFWNLVEHFSPDYKAARKWLSDNAYWMEL